MTILFSVVIPTFNRPTDLARCLDCLMHYSDENEQKSLGFQIEFIVTDDGCDSNVHPMLMNDYPWCRYCKGPGRGPAANRNYGASHALGEWIVFTDDDCLPQPGWLEAFATYVQDADVLEGRTSAYGRRNRVDEEVPTNEHGGSLIACNFAIRSQIFNVLGGFNEGFPAPAMEDNELNVRINRLSLQRKFIQTALVLHPWRRRKGISYQKSHAESVAYFVKLYPHYSGSFVLSSQARKLVKALLSSILFSLKTGIYSGIFRQLWLDCYGNYYAWRAVQKVLNNTL
jgi:glycosyltransferase involved in cell wall biosynthesis